MTDLIPALPVPSATLAAAFVLVSWWKALLLFFPFLGWAWIISTIYDKHAAQFFLPRRKWNIAHMVCGFAAIMLGLLVGVLVGPGEGAFWAGFGAMLGILIADLLAYAYIANKDERVPEKHRVSFTMPRPGVVESKDKKKDKKEPKVLAKVALTIRGADEKGKFTKTVVVPAAEMPEYEVRTAAESFFMSAQHARAAQVEMGPTGKDQLYSASWMVDGVKQPGESMPAANAARIMDFWKAAAGLDVADRRRKQTGVVQVEEGVLKTMTRVTSIGAQGGMKLTMLLNPEQQVNKKIEELGLLEPQMKELKGIVEDGKGVVLLTSPLDGGRSTTLYSVLKMHDAYTSNVQTVETDPQAAIEGVRVNRFDPQGDSTTPILPGAQASQPGGEFSTLVRSILRRDPDVVGVAELPDPQTAKEIAKADQERTRTYLSFRSGDALSTIQAYVKSVGEPKQAAETLHGVINQRLLRRLCTNCRQAYPPSADMLKKLGVPEGRVQQLFKKGGQVLIKNKPELCPTCGGGGYFGQEGVFEVYSIGKEERDLIAQNNYPGLKAAFRKKTPFTIQQVAIRKAIDGITSVEEVQRVTASESTGAGSASPPATSGAIPPAASNGSAGGGPKTAPAKPKSAT